MTNRQRLDNLDTKTFVSQMQGMFKNPFAKYIAFDEYLDSEDTDIRHFIRHKGKCIVKPTDMELRTDVSAECRKDCLWLDETSLFGNSYVIVADLQYNKLMQVSADLVVKEV